jgi:hypothetical protein
VLLWILFAAFIFDSFGASPRSLSSSSIDTFDNCHALQSFYISLYNPYLRPGNESPIGPLHCPGICSMYTSKIREIMTHILPL